MPNEKTETTTAKDLQVLLMRNLTGLDDGSVTVDRANAIARLSNTVFQGVRTRLKVQVQSGDSVSGDLKDWAK